MTILESLIAELKGVCAGLPDQRKGPRHDGEYTMADIGLSAFSVFFMGSPSFLGHQRRLEEGHGRSNCQTLFGMTAIPTDAYTYLASTIGNLSPKIGPEQPRYGNIAPGQRNSNTGTFTVRTIKLVMLPMISSCIRLWL